MSESWTEYESPLGTLTIVVSSKGALTALRFPGGPAPDEARKAAAARGHGAARRILRRRQAAASTWRSSFGGSRFQLAGLGTAARDPLRGDRELRADRGRPRRGRVPDRPRAPRAGPRGRHRDRPHPGPDRRSLPPGGRRRRLADRLRRRARPQAGPARPRERPARALLTGRRVGREPVRVGG